jgi:FG-GAP-like repeat
MGASYGDDYQSDTNFPLVQIVNNATGHTFFARTFNHSTRSVAVNAAVTTSFQAAAATETGASTLYVIANGIASAGTAIMVAASCPNTTATHDFNGDGESDIAWRDGNGDTAIWLMNGTTVLSSGGVGTVPAAWSIVGQRDFNGDGKADLL